MATTWSHRAARALVRPLIGTGVTPNHLTTLRLLSGLAACGAVAWGTQAGVLWGGGLWLVSAFLDRADGELARVGDMMSEAGHRYDYVCDVAVNALVFAAAGVGARHGWLGLWAVLLGVATSLLMIVCWVVGEAYQQERGTPEKAYAGRWGFDVDDGMYLIAPLIWLHVMSFVIVAAAFATSILAGVIIVRLHRLRSRSLRADPPPPYGRPARQARRGG